MATLPAEERETIIVINDSDDIAVIVTHSRTWLTALENNPAATFIKGDNFGGKEFHIDKRFISKPRNGPRKRTETPEQVAARMEKARATRSQGGK